MINRVFMQPSIPIQQQQSTQEGLTLQQQRRESQFQRILDEKLGQEGQLTFSAHALQRLEQRDITLTSNDLNRLQSAVEQVEAKGGRDTLIHINDVSYVINVPNRTVITAVDGASNDGSVFTQIDSAMVLN